jgi:hypothetical protein
VAYFSLLCATAVAISICNIIAFNIHGNYQSLPFLLTTNNISFSSSGISLFYLFSWFLSSPPPPVFFLSATKAAPAR